MSNQPSKPSARRRGPLGNDRDSCGCHCCCCCYCCCGHCSSLSACHVASSSPCCPLGSCFRNTLPQCLPYQGVPVPTAVIGAFAGNCRPSLFEFTNHECQWLKVSRFTTTLFAIEAAVAVKLTAAATRMLRSSFK